ncbi:MAG: hypothetical protein J6C40_10520 [Lentisphaeria bacterium]|nr:hypothetical protein [Lentisphaeria bacterium]
MKKFFFILNILLAVAAVGMTFANLSGGKGKKEEYSVKKSSKKSSSRKVPVNYSVKTPTADQESTIVSNNLFNPVRNPNARNGRGGRVQLTLVGIFESGEHKGAVILQKGGQRNMPFRPGMNGMNGMGRMGMMNRGQNNAFQTQIQQAPQQYIRLGETLSNGYTLTEVTRTSATLTRSGGGKMVLELQEASKNQPQAARRAVRQNPIVQQMQQMQRMQMFQNMQMMRMMRQTMQQNNNNAAGNRGGTTRRR